MQLTQTWPRLPQQSGWVLFASASVSQPVNVANPTWNLSLDWRDVSSFVQNAIFLHPNTLAKCHSFISKKWSVLMHLVFYTPLHVRTRHSPATLRRGGALAQSPGGGGAAAGYKLGLLHTCPQTPLLHSVAALPEPGFPSDTRALPLPVQPDTRL